MFTGKKKKDRPACEVERRRIMTSLCRVVKANRTLARERVRFPRDAPTRSPPLIKLTP
jgi:hypothetical protein